MWCTQMLDVVAINYDKREWITIWKGFDADLFQNLNNVTKFVLKKTFQDMK